VKLESVFEIARGGSPRPIDDYITDADDGLNWISIKDASNSDKYIEKTKLKIKPEGLSKTRQVKPGDFLLTNSMSFGRPYIMKTTGCIHDGWLVLSGNPEKVDSDYFYHLLGSDLLKRRFSALAAGAVVKNLNIDLVKGVEIPLPPLPEQKRIAAILDKADAIRRKRQQAIQLADDFLRAVFLDMFGDPVTNPKGWPSVKLGEVCGVGSSKRVFVDEFTDTGVPFYRGTEVGALGEGQKIQAELFISQEHYDDLVSHSGAPEVGDLLLPSICHDGRIWKVNHKEQFYFKDGRVLWIKLNRELIDSDYLRSYLQRMFLSNYSAIASGTTFAELKIVNLKAMNILSPPLALQRKFSELVKAISETGKLYANADLEGEDLFSSLAKQAFSGQL
jgi:type I restriction enzyme S subunit